MTNWLTRLALFAGFFASATGAVWAQEATIRRNITERLPSISKIEEISKTGMPGLYELRTADNDIFYTDAEGNYLIEGALIDAKQRRNLTEERLEKLSAIDFSELPLKDSFTVVRGNGKRKMAVFEDPNCGYCKRFERDLQGITNVTIHMFLYPVLGPSSAERSKNLWCTKDKVKAWLDWMVRDAEPSAAPANCDASALKRNSEFGRKYRITGTPTLLFTDGTRVPGAISAVQVEKFLTEAK